MSSTDTDPAEDTVRCCCSHRHSITPRSTDTDPAEDTVSGGTNGSMIATIGGSTDNDPAEDTVSQLFIGIAR